MPPRDEGSQSHGSQEHQREHHASRHVLPSSLDPCSSIDRRERDDELRRVGPRLPNPTLGPRGGETYDLRRPVLTGHSGVHAKRRASAPGPSPGLWSPPRQGTGQTPRTRRVEPRLCPSTLIRADPSGHSCRLPAGGDERTGTRWSSHHLGALHRHARSRPSAVQVHEQLA